MVAVAVAVSVLVMMVVFVAGWRVQGALRRRRMTPRQRELERLAAVLLRLARRLPARQTVQDPQSGRWFTVQRRLVVVAIGVVDADGFENPSDAVVTWYLVTRWGSPPDTARVLRHQKPAGHSFGVTSRQEADELLDMEAATGALGADPEELGLLVAELQRATD